MSLLGFESDATSVPKMRRRDANRQSSGRGGGFFRRDELKARDRQARLDVQVRSPANPIQTGMQSTKAERPCPPSLPDSPQPMSIDPQSAVQTPSSWPNQIEGACTYPMPASADQEAQPIPPFDGAHNAERYRSTTSLPFAKVCHNFLLIKHQKAARKRNLLIQHRKRVQAEQDAREEREGRMQVDTPAQAVFPARSQAVQLDTGTHRPDGTTPSVNLPGQLTVAELLPPLPHASPRTEAQHQVSIRNLAGIARVDESKPPRKRRRDLSPESTYRALGTPHLSHSPPRIPTMEPSGTFTQSRPSAAVRSASYDPVSRPEQWHLDGMAAGPLAASSPSPPVAGPSDPSTPRSRSLLPSVEIQTPSPHQEVPLRRRGWRGDPKGNIYRFGEEDRSHLHLRAEQMDRRQLEDTKHQRRDAWLEDIEERRFQGAKRGHSRAGAWK